MRMQKTGQTFVLALLVVLLAGCASVRSSTEVDANNIQISGTEQPSQVVSENLAKPYQSPLGDIPLDEHELVRQWVNYFQGRGRKHMEVYLQRSSRYLPMMRNTLRENGLPEDLVYVALIESGFSPLAHSHANAVGYWQFIRGTGKRYGLTLDPFIDERRDPVLSTRAAAEYFKALYNLFGSWHLSLAAYNVGENRVKRAVMKYYTRNFWELIKHRRALPKETKHYVPKFIAATLIAKDPAKYGFTDIPYQAPLEFDTVSLTNPVSLTKLSAAMGVDVEEMKLLNPKFRGDYVPMYRGAETVLRVPLGKTQIAAASIPGSQISAPKVVNADYYFYRVRSGDTLSTIARRHRTSLNRLRSLNGLSNRSLLRIGQRLRVPDRGGSYVTYEMPKESAESDKSSEGASQDSASEDGERETAGETRFHVVRRGENLSIIARRYGLSVEELLKINGLHRRSVLRVGQQLKLRTEEDSVRSERSLRKGRKLAAKSSRPAAKMVKQVSIPKRHKVRRGETLSQIAERYKVPMAHLAKKNSLRKGSHLLAGSELIIPAAR